MIMSGSSHRHYSSQSSNTIHHKVHTGIKVFNQHQVLHPEPTERDPAPTRHKFTIHPSPEKFTRQNPTHQAASHQTEGPLLAPLLIIKNRRISALVSSVAFLFSSTCRLYSSNSLRVFSSASSVLWDFCFSTITSSWRSAEPCLSADSYASSALSLAVGAFVGLMGCTPMFFRKMLLLFLGSTLETTSALETTALPSAGGMALRASMSAWHNPKPNVN